MAIAAFIIYTEEHHVVFLTFSICVLPHLFFDFAASGYRFWLPLLVAVLRAKTIHGILLLDLVSSEK
ncbi:MAG: hypothetical protein ABSH41_00065 [Syntrophobacteraceae bacterium]|jgi:hypothetical protein